MTLKVLSDIVAAVLDCWQDVTYNFVVCELEYVRKKVLLKKYVICGFV